MTDPENEEGGELDVELTLPDPGGQGATEGPAIARPVTQGVMDERTHGRGRAAGR